MEYWEHINRKKPNEVIQLFLSQENICNLHEAIIDRVLHETGVRIFRQEDEDLIHFMYESLEIYDMYVLPNAIEMVRFLNDRTINNCVYRIKNEILMQIQYLKDASTLPTPLQRPAATTTDHSLPLFK
tara:strand:+ start:25079 stop:25462 length:384 start_codon:yes stop_codon:yes gene_type:complete